MIREGRVLKEELFFPTEMNTETVLVFFIMVAGFFSVLFIEGLAQKKKVMEVNP